MIGPVALVIVVAIFTPALALLLGPPVPMSVMVPLVVVLSVPAVRKIPWHAPVVPKLLAVIWMALADVEEVVTSSDAKNPTPPLPCPSMVLVAVMSPVVVKAAATLTPWPPVVPLSPPIQLEKVTAPLPVKRACKSTPWLAVPVPPTPVRVIRPDVPGVQEFVLTETPAAEAAVPELVPLTVIVPDVLVRESVELAILTPTLATALVPVVPVREIAPLPVAVEISPVLLMLIPCEASVVLAPPVPMRVKAPPPVVLRVPAVTEIP